MKVAGIVTSARPLLFTANARNRATTVVFVAHPVQLSAGAAAFGAPATDTADPAVVVFVFV